MATLVQARSRLELTSDGTWDWYAFVGILWLISNQSRAGYQGAHFITEADIYRMARDLENVMYVAKGFSDTPGRVLQAQLQIDPETLCHRMVIDGQKAVSSNTTGKFTISCFPSFRAGTPPVKDPLGIHHGTWKILTPDNNHTSCE